MVFNSRVVPVFMLQMTKISGLSILISSIVQSDLQQVIAVDQRGHGDTYTTNDTDLSADTLTGKLG